MPDALIRKGSDPNTYAQLEDSIISFFSINLKFYFIIIIIKMINVESFYTGRFLWNRTDNLDTIFCLIKETKGFTTQLYIQLLLSIL